MLGGSFVCFFLDAWKPERQMEARLESSIAHAPGIHPGTLEDEAVSGAEDADSMPLQSGPQSTSSFSCQTADSRR